jgi:NAD(P)-dependent dehydrogenase (short-subunit alcohol dehydrogenase family)
MFAQGADVGQPGARATLPGSREAESQHGRDASSAPGCLPVALSAAACPPRASLIWATMDSRIVLISGGARGIGSGVARALAGAGHRVIITARDEDIARDAAAALSEGSSGAVRGLGLDVDDDRSVERVIESVQSTEGRLDSLVNNAGLVGGYDTRAGDVDLNAVKSVLETNLFGAWRMTQAVLPLLRESAAPRIVNISSGMGQLDEMGQGAVAYRISKVALNALTRVVANEEREAGILVNTMCPGWVKTDLGGPSAPRTIEEGADTAVWLATLPDGGPTGGFFRDREPIPW